MGILARTMQLTEGSVFKSFGGGSDLVSTGMDFGSRCDSGVPASGVAGGVKAGLSKLGGGEPDLSCPRS